MCKSNRKTIIDIICAAFFVISAIVFLLNYKIIPYFVSSQSDFPVFFKKNIYLKLLKHKCFCLGKWRDALDQPRSTICSITRWLALTNTQI